MDVVEWVPKAAKLVKGTMRAEIQKVIAHDYSREGSSGWGLIALLGLGVPWGIWSASVLYQHGGPQMVAVDVMMGCFILLAIGYLGLYRLRGGAWCSVPILVTLEALAVYIGIPAWRFAKNDSHVDSFYVHAMFLVLIGFTAFWIGTLAVMKENRFQFVLRERKTSSRVAYMSVAMLVLGLCGKLVMWRSGLYSYIADPAVRESSLWFLQWLGFLGNLLNAALIVSAIEVVGKHSIRPLINIVFWLSFVSSVAFGVISGMKGEILFPLLYIVFVYVIANERFPKYVLLLFILPILIYPFSNAYRSNLSQGYGIQTNTVEGLGEVLQKSFNDVVGSGSTRSQTSNQGLEDTTSRLSYLTYVRDTISLPDPSVLKGDEKIWLAPIYPLVPRVLWKNKPIPNKGLRLTVALGRPADSSSAVTIVGDLYSMYGTPGVVFGMLGFGICFQIYMNWVACSAMSESRLFVFISLLVLLANFFEADVSGFIQGAIQSGIVIMLTSYVIYGRSIFSPEIQINCVQ